jgi:hypothetical protein
MCYTEQFVYIVYGLCVFMVQQGDFFIIVFSLQTIIGIYLYFWTIFIRHCGLHFKDRFVTPCVSYDSF